MNKLRLIFTLLVFVLFGCGDANETIERPDVSHVPVEVKIIRLEQELFESQSRGEVKAFLQENKLFAQKFLDADQYPADSILVDQLYALVNNQSLDTVYQETQQVFEDMEGIRQDFETAFQYIKYYYPDFEAPTIYTMVTGFGKDLYISEEMIVIGLDFFLGPDASYRPVKVPNYILRRYTPRHIVPTCMLLLSQRFNQTDPQDNTLLADMIYYGKSYYFTDFVLPDTPDSVLIGYTAEEMAGVEANEKAVWTHFLSNELLYETSPVVKKKYLDERPATLEIGNKAPGRIGTWLGWQIVKSYMEERDELTLRELMEQQQARKILEEARYRPE